MIDHSSGDVCRPLAAYSSFGPDIWRARNGASILPPLVEMISDPAILIQLCRGWR